MNYRYTSEYIDLLREIEATMKLLPKLNGLALSVSKDTKYLLERAVDIVSLAHGLGIQPVVQIVEEVPPVLEIAHA